MQFTHNWQSEKRVYAMLHDATTKGRCCRCMMCMLWQRRHAPRAARGEHQR
jgi:hypothetical protein